VTQGINALGWAIPPFIIFAAKNHDSVWYEGSDLPPGLAISVSDNGWTTDIVSFDWLVHFDKHTQTRTKGVYRLLILDGHGSHETVEFQLFCENNKIITLCMPPHSSHLLQPLDVGCFAPLKKAYGQQIEDLMRNHINHITKLEFLPAFRAAFNKSITSDNICGSFRGAGLIPFNPDAVISKLDVRLRTPTPPPAADVAPWSAKTLGNRIEMVSQTELIKGRITQHQNSSPTPIIDGIDQILKGTVQIAAQYEILKAEVTALRKANEALSRRKRRQKKRIQRGGTLTIAEGVDLINQANVDAQIQRERRERAVQSGGDAPRQRRCGRCRQPGHNITTCPQHLLDEIEARS
jgi:DDE superfamily endonuclease